MVHTLIDLSKRETEAKYFCEPGRPFVYKKVLRGSRSCPPPPRPSQRPRLKPVRRSPCGSPQALGNCTPQAAGGLSLGGGGGPPRAPSGRPGLPPSCADVFPRPSRVWAISDEKYFGSKKIAPLRVPAGHWLGVRVALRLFVGVFCFPLGCRRLPSIQASASMLHAKVWATRKCLFPLPL